jgi:histidinol-phosphate aminotransferase
MLVVDVPYERDLSFPWRAVRQELASEPRLCFVCNPNNPTGTLLEPHRILDLASEHPSTLFVVDEVYEPFTGQSVLPAACALDNVLTLRSLSKSMGLAALRIGFACGSPGLVERAFRVTGPYDINQVAVVAAMAALADPDHVRNYVEEVARAKLWTREKLSEMGLEHRGEGGNYLLVWPTRDVTSVEGSLRARGILVRGMRGKPVIDGSFRVSIGTMGQMQRFVQALDAALSERT